MADYQDINNRIDRMEAKLDKLVDAVTELVRVDAQLRNMSERLNNHSAQIKELDVRADAIEVKLPVYDMILRSMGKVFLAVITLIVTGIIASFFVF